ncbi:glycosyl hydrolase [Catalinimonas niigatensis]|uniref:glycosyl hydrolase n=1 Tax=Catalinimonas niigatensis TaxID=1397264 RepID=UPI002666C2F0|nr:glycosyl hydrolase [Catalinimonas niigatensis]WPP50918.1 glycosyl hydrolase [Catalinimonas niigatensis]
MINMTTSDRIFQLLLICILLIIPQLCFSQIQWPEITPQNKPWTRWWWMGSSINEKDVSDLLETYKEAGLGGVEITPIYGVAGYEEHFIPYLSDKWVQKLTFTFKEAARLKLGVDMATGTGWPFGGPWIGAEEASKYVAYKTYTLNAGQRLNERVVYLQQPLVRAVGNQIYESYGIYKLNGEKIHGSRQNPLLKENSKPIDISDIKEPITANKNLQALALDQVRFEKSLPLQTLMAYSNQGEVLNLTDKVNDEGNLDWTASDDKWTLYAVFQGWHGKMVERAAPGGEGYVIDHFSQEAIRVYLEKFDQALTTKDISSLRSFFNDSYEVDDASGQANWTPELWDEFGQRRGYDLREHLPALFGNDAEDKNKAVLSDYRETISELLLENFTQPWQEWAHGKDAIIRNQAHGSPANILDLYAASDIPETEGNEVLRFKFATSAANVAGRELVSAEAATWLNEHFTSTLSDVKEAVDRFFLGGVNHIFYHGTNYSPQQEEWPGWLFYAAVHFSPSNPLWADLDALNTYIAHTQSFLQMGHPDNDILLYYPVYDYYAERGNELLRHFDGFEESDKSSFKNNVNLLQKKGYAFDMISDKQLQKVTYAEKSLVSANNLYQTIVVPNCEYMPLNTLQKIMQLAEGGASIIVHRALPASIPGLRKDNLEEFRKLKAQLYFKKQSNGIQEATVGQGRIIMGNNFERLMSYASVRREVLVDQGLQFVRRVNDNQHLYFLKNQGDKPLEGWVPIQATGQLVAIYDPMRKKSGLASVRNTKNRTLEVYLQLAPGESCILQTFPNSFSASTFPYYQVVGKAIPLEGSWSIDFMKGGPTLPSSINTSTLRSWTALKQDEIDKFSGTARYSLNFPLPSGEYEALRLDLGTVKESATVYLNGEVLETLLGPNYSITIDRNKMMLVNKLEVEVSNLMANRIADLDQRKVGWKKFYNINFPARLSENRNANGLFDASQWSPKPSGLMGPVTLTPLNKMKL